VGTHCALGVKLPDGKITGCYVHFDGATMRERIEQFIREKTTTGLVMVITKAQLSGGLRSFYSLSRDLKTRETEFLDDDTPYVISDLNWEEDHFGTYYKYLVDYETGKISAWCMHDGEMREYE